MTKKDFELIAKALLASQPPTLTREYDGWQAARDRITLALVDTNPRFDKMRFAFASTVGNQADLAKELGIDPPDGL